jgi:hypothetical protein
VVASVFAVTATSFGVCANKAYAGTLAADLAGEAIDAETTLPAGSGTTGYAQSVLMGSGYAAGSCWQANATGALSLGEEGSALSAMRLQLGYADSGAVELYRTGSVSYRVDAGDGWGKWVSDGATAGDAEGEGSVYAVEVALSGEVADAYDVRYRVYVDGLGWLGWAENGDTAGTASFGRAVEKIEVELVERVDDDQAQSDPYAFLGMPVLELGYTSDGESWTAAENGLVPDGAGLAGLSVALAGDDAPDGSIVANALVGGEWTELSHDGSGSAPGAFTQIAFALEGDVANWVDIQYRAYVSGRGWLGWAENGDAAGCVSYAGTVQAVEVRLVPKGEALPDGGEAVYDGSLAGRSAALVAAALETPCPGAGWCARWVSEVYEAAGLGYPGGNACDMYWTYCTSSDLADLEPGMIVAVPAHTWTESGQVYGHVGIYVGDGMVMDSLDYVRTISLDDWISDYSMLYEVKWGWAL